MRLTRVSVELGLHPGILHLLLKTLGGTDRDEGIFLAQENDRRRRLRIDVVCRRDVLPEIFDAIVRPAAVRTVVVDRIE